MTKYIQVVINDMCLVPVELNSEKLMIDCENLYLYMVQYEVQYEYQGRAMITLRTVSLYEYHK